MVDLRVRHPCHSILDNGSWTTILLPFTNDVEAPSFYYHSTPDVSKSKWIFSENLTPIKASQPKDDDDDQNDELTGGGLDHCYSLGWVVSRGVDMEPVEGARQWKDVTFALP